MHHTQFTISFSHSEISTVINATQLRFLKRLFKLKDEFNLPDNLLQKAFLLPHSVAFKPYVKVCLSDYDELAYLSMKNKSFQSKLE